MFRIEMLPASNGDCLWVEYGSSTKPNRILIDGGTAPTYEMLRQKILGLTPEERRFELLVVTHVDADHVEGAVRLLEDHYLTFEDIWFNGWRHLPPRTRDLLGPVQGEYLTALINKRALPWNCAFSSEAVAIPDIGNLPTVTLSAGLRITLLSPTTGALSLLKPVWKREVREAGLDPANQVGVLDRLKKDRRLGPKDRLGEKTPDVRSLADRRFTEDSSETNRSSIAFLAEFKDNRKTKSCLFLGDAHPSVIQSGITRLLRDRGKTALAADAVKIAHHGSKNNTSVDLINKLECKRFLISTDGSTFGHPDQEAIARLLKLGGSGCRLFFNYKTDHNRMWKDPNLSKRWHFIARFPQNEHEGMTVEL